MQVVRLRHVKRYSAGGKTYWYHRITRERLPDDAQARVARVLEINRTLEGRRDDAVPGSLLDLISQYRARPEFTGLATSTQSGYLTYLDMLARAYPAKAVEDIDRAWLYELRDAMSMTPRAANLTLALVSILMAFAVDHGWRANNPAIGVKKLRGGKSYESWPDVALERFRADANPRMVWALELALYTGQRQGDVLAMQWRHIRDGLISVAQAKTGERLAIPVHRNLAMVLEDIPRGHFFIVHRQNGRPYTTDGFRSIFYGELRRLGLSGLQFHGLRHTAGKLLAEAGCTDREIMAILGHRTAAMVGRYTRGAEQTRLAKAAIIKLETRTKVSKLPDESV